MKNNIMIIVVVTVVAIAVIMTVILASVSNGSGKTTSDGSDPSYSSTAPNGTDPYPNGGESSGGNTPGTTPNGDSYDAAAVEGIVATANSLIGVPFEENGATPDGFDNSGFIYYVLRENGYLTCPRTTEGQAKMGATLKLSELKRGDLAFFKNEDDTFPGFGGIYIGGGKMIACLMPGTVVKEVDITTPYYNSSFFCGISLS